jgi:4a-hydroxytetrahydrobiopterin dehydratase
MDALTSDELMRAIEGLEGWEPAVSARPGKEGRERTELKKVYSFASFEDAMDFMAMAARHISTVDHHPRWENRFRTVTVWLSTWSAGHKPSRLDIELAQFMDGLYSGYEHPKM